MKRVIGLMIGLSLVGAYARADEKPAGATEKKMVDSEATTILKKVDAAARAVKAVKYNVKAKGTGSAAARAGEVEATVLFTEIVGMQPQKYRCEAHIKLPGSTEVKHVTVGSDGEEYYLLDHAEKKAYADIDPAVLGRMGGSIFQSTTVIEFLHPTPFQDEIDAKEKKVLSTKTIDGVECYVVDVTYPQGQKAIWSFGKNDFLPRERIDQRAGPDGQTGGQIKTLTNLDVHPKIDESTFKFKIPEGYTQVDDFAP